MPDMLDVQIAVHADQKIGAYKPLWNWFGYDEPNYTYSDNGRKLLAALSATNPVATRIRTHNLLTSGDGLPALKWGSTNVYTEDAAGNARYDWTIMDRIFDAYDEAGVVPFIQAGFTPEALSNDRGPYRHAWSPDDRYATITTGWAAPPNDLNKWGDLIFAWARHLADRFGEQKVSDWPWEVWNEPDGHYWTGTVAEFCALYDVTANAIKRALPGARVGGPHTCGAADNPKAEIFLRAFLQHVSDTGAPLDFVAFHAKGQPEVHDGHVRMGISKQLRDIVRNLAILGEFPKLAGLPVIIGESDPEGCAACSARVHPQNAYRNGPLYGAYIVESMMQTYALSRRSSVEIEGAVTWAFQFDDQPFFDGFRDLATNGIGKAVLNAFRMMGKLGGDWITASSSHALGFDEILANGVRNVADINVVATTDDTGVSLLVWHYHDDDVGGPDANIAITLDGLPEGIGHLTHFRMDDGHSNAFAVWKQLGGPQNPDTATYQRLEESSVLAVLEDSKVQITDGALNLRCTLPRQGVSLFRLELNAQP